MPFGKSIEKEEDDDSENSTPLGSASRTKLLKVPTVGML